MPFDIIGFAEGTPGTGTVNLAGALGDTLYRVNGDDILVKKEASYLLGVFYESLTTPASWILRQPKMIDIHGIKSKLGTDLMPDKGYEHFFGRPLPLRGGDKLNALSVNATDEITMIGCILGSGRISQAALDAVNPTHMIRGYADQALTAHTWTPANVTWNESLEAGVYAVIGMRGSTYKAATPQNALARLVIPGKTDWRPGIVLGAMAGDKTIYDQELCGKWVDWPLQNEITIDPNIGMPNLELLSTVANTDHVVELLLQKL